VVDKLGLDYPILSDGDREVITAYGLVHSGASIDGGDIARPATFVIGGDGRVVWRNLTENWRVRVRPDTVIEALEILE
jgi:peroxiredoxin